jgi:MFS superfamily sulfate permease-like transporter
VDRGIAVIGPVAAGLPGFRLPQMAWKDLEPLIPVAASCFVVIVTQSAATARTYALSHRESLDENADLAGLAAANGLAALSGAFVVNGSPTQTTIVESAGSKSQLAQLSAAVVIALILGFFTRPLQYLPKCVLGSIVFMVAIRLMKLRELRDIRRESPGEFLLAATTAAVVVLVGVEQGIVLAMVMSLLRVVQHSYHPHSGVLVRGPGDVFQVTPVVPGAQSEPGLTVYRFGAPLFYANVGRFAEEIRTIVSATPPRWIVVDAAPITKVDFTAARIMENLLNDLKARNVVLAFGHVEPELQADLDRHHLTDRIGRDHIFDRLHEAIDAWHRLAG